MKFGMLPEEYCRVLRTQDGVVRYIAVLKEGLGLVINVKIGQAAKNS